MVLYTSSQPTVDTMSKLVHIRKKKTAIGRDRNSVDVYVACVYAIPSINISCSCNSYLDSSHVPRMISRVHAYIICGDNGQWYIRDNRSVNGVFLNDEKVFDSRIKNRDIITFGGGGNLARGTIKSQPRSEFNFVFIIHNEGVDILNDPNNSKKRDSSDNQSTNPSPSEGDYPNKRPKR